MTNWLTKLKRKYITAALSHEIASIGNRTDLLETKHDELSLAHNDLRKDYENLADFFCRRRSRT